MGKKQMKMWKSFVRKNILWIILALMLVGINLFYLYLLKADVRDIEYAVLLDLFLIIVLTLTGFILYWKKVKQLQKLLEEANAKGIVMPETEDEAEKLYGQMIENAQIARKLTLSKTEKQQAEMKEYYARWVHQIKTPIAALKLLLQVEKDNLEEKIATMEVMPEEEETAQKKELLTIVTEKGQKEEFETKETKEQKALSNDIIYKSPKRQCKEQIQRAQEEEYRKQTAFIADMEDEVFKIEQYAGMALQYQRILDRDDDYLLEKVSLDKVIRESIRKYAKVMIRKKIPVCYEGCEESVISDEKWLSFVLEQILSNAIKYQKEKIDSDDRSVLIEVSHRGNWIYVKVQDHGIGIREEDIPRVFEKGYTGFNGHEDKHSTGIGLYLCKQALSRLGHTIWIESKPGEGTAVWIGFCQET